MNVRQAVSLKDFETVWRLTHDVYVREGYADPRPEGILRHYPRHDLIDETIVLMAESEPGTLLGSISLTVDGPRGLPMDEDFKDEIDRFRAHCSGEDKKLGAYWRFVAQHSLEHETSVALQLIGASVEFGRRVPLDEILYIVNPKHVGFYRRLLSLEPIGKTRGSHSVKGAPAVLLHGDRAHVLAAWARVQMRRPSPRQVAPDQSAPITIVEAVAGRRGNPAPHERPAAERTAACIRGAPLERKPMPAAPLPATDFPDPTWPNLRTRRPISINNSLVQGICNYSCQLCGVNKPHFAGPKGFQSRHVTSVLLARVKEASRAGIHVRYIANAGDGEPTLHPEFQNRMAMFGDLIRNWDVAGAEPPEVSVVTNGTQLMEPDILETFTANPLTLIISFPTPVPEAYGEIMTGHPEQGTALLEKVTPGIEAAMKLRAHGRIRRLYFHISPPDREIVRRDFAQTVEFLTRLSARAGLKDLEMTLFPATANRSGLVRSLVTGTDLYKDFFREYQGKTVNGVTVRLTIVLKRFFYSLGEIADLVSAFEFPCLWNANFFITHQGDSICCNDQAVRNPQGNIQAISLCALLQQKENRQAAAICTDCNQRPDRMRGSWSAVLFSAVVVLRMVLRKATGGGRAVPALAHEAPQPQRWLAALQVVLTMLVLAAVPGNGLKLAAFVLLWSVTFWPLRKMELVAYLSICGLFSLMDVWATGHGLFAFTQPDIAGLPVFEFFVWGFFVLNARRFVGGPTPPFQGTIVMPLALLFAMPFVLHLASNLLFGSTLVVLAALVFFFHDHWDLRCLVYWVLVGAGIEILGVRTGQWHYPDAPWGGVPPWFITMWGGVGLLSRRLVWPMAELWNRKTGHH